MKVGTALKRVGAVLLGGAMAMTLSACYGGACASCFTHIEPGCTPAEIDGDGDGFCGEFDCDDEDAERHVWADEILNDGVDQNCDGYDG